MKYTDHRLLKGVRTTKAPITFQTAAGYGDKIPTRHMINYAGRWRRVYVMQFGNAGSAYVIVKGLDHFLDTETEHACVSA